MRKATGIVRCIDPLGRITIPMELRRTLTINNGDPLAIYVEDDAIVLKKYQPGCIFCGALDKQMVQFKNYHVCPSCHEEIKAR